MKTWIFVIALFTCLIVKYTDAGNVLEGAECGGTTGDVCDATVSNLNCGVEDCYKCRCATGYTWNSGTSACDTSSGSREVNSASVVAMVTSVLFAVALSYT